MTLRALLRLTGDYSQAFGNRGAVQVFNRTEQSWRYLPAPTQTGQ